MIRYKPPPSGIDRRFGPAFNLATAGAVSLFATSVPPRDKLGISIRESYSVSSLEREFFNRCEKIRIEPALRGGRALCHVRRRKAEPGFCKPLVGSSNLSPGTAFSAGCSRRTRRRGGRDDRVAARGDRKRKTPPRRG